ncbi:DNA cytosine methyltransferase [Uniformispora flossi]|uniref:DNA cytosine methyltransferase n=1 Tax=Uniformispora flossi TaxID=3390723 RepID=UPI003C2E802A
MSASEGTGPLDVVEICAGAGGQSLGLHRAGFRHLLAVELDANAAETLRVNAARTGEDWDIRIGDAADPDIWEPDEYKGVDLLAGGVPCPPFSIAGKQIGAGDERDLFAWAVSVCTRIQPKALLLENVRGLSTGRFAAYRQEVWNRLQDAGYIPFWQLIHAADFGVPQLRPRFVLVALQAEFAPYFAWPQPKAGRPPTVGETLVDLMAANGWEGAAAWAEGANDIAPTIVGGSKKHGGADLGPTRAKKAWAKLGVDALGVNDAAPPAGWRAPDGVPGPKLTTEMVARIQGWSGDDWVFHGKKTTRYRQIGNAFPPPVAQALGESIARALRKEGEPQALVESTEIVLDPVYKILRSVTKPLSVEQIIAQLAKSGVQLSVPEVERHLSHISRDFALDTVERASGRLGYELREFKAFVGQEDHERHDLFTQLRMKIS